MKPVGRLYYLAQVGGRESLGVLGKIRDKLCALEGLGRPVTGIVLFKASEPLPEPEPRLEFLHSARGRGLNPVIERLKRTLQPEDCVVLRYPLASAALKCFLQAFPRRVWLEHNTKEMEELRTNFRRYTLRDWLWMVRQFQFRDVAGNLSALWQEWRWGRACLALARGGIGVTGEICAYEEKRCKGYRCYTVSNGIDTSRFPALDPLTYDGESLRMIMASTSGHEWHGLDRLIEGLRRYRGPVQVHLDLVGRFTSTVQQLVARHQLESQVTFHPPSKGPELQQLLVQSHLGIGSLGMHRIPLRQGSVLKVKEYMALGIPFVVAHEEVDLVDCPEFAPFYLQLPADDSPVDIARMVDFVESVHSEPDYRQRISGFSRQLVDVRAKMSRLLEVVQARPDFS